MFIVVVNPWASQLPAADATVIAEGPVTLKSLPLAAMDEHRIGEGKISFNNEGEQPIGERLSIGTGDAGGIVNNASSPAVVLLLQLAVNVLPSLPVTICTWKFPSTVMGAES